ncbi:MAG: hypothetical protein IT259_20555 [Saprospiraceae bacterium]|nr:hypothetical protein [Saprospiraceae bacterium]
MKTTVLLIALVLAPFLSFAQQQQRDLSRAEEMSAKSGTLIERRFNDLSQVKGINIQILTVIDLVTKDSINALYLSYVKSSTYSTDTKTAILDKDELAGLITSLRIITNEFQSERAAYTEITFMCGSGFKAGAYFDPSPGALQKKKWIGFVRLEQFDSNSQVFLSVDDLKMFLQIVEIANQRM